MIKGKLDKYRSKTRLNTVGILIVKTMMMSYFNN